MSDGCVREGWRCPCGDQEIPRYVNWRNKNHIFSQLTLWTLIGLDMGDSESTHTSNNHITFPAAHISPELYIWETFPLDLITMQGWLCGLIDKIQAMMNGNFNVNIYLVKARTFKVEQADSQII